MRCLWADYFKRSALSISSLRTHRLFWARTHFWLDDEILAVQSDVSMMKSAKLHSEYEPHGARKWSWRNKRNHSSSVGTFVCTATPLTRSEVLRACSVLSRAHQYSWWTNRDCLIYRQLIKYSASCWTQEVRFKIQILFTEIYNVRLKPQTEPELVNRDLV